MADSSLIRTSSKPEIPFGNGSWKGSMKSLKSKPSGLSVMIEEQASKDMEESEINQKLSDNKWDNSELKKMSDATLNTERGGIAKGSQMTDFHHMLHLTVKPQRKKTPLSLRTAMGELIVADGSKPLTSLAIPTPGPSDYSPNMALTMPCVAQYSIVGKPKYAKVYRTPAPNEYRTGKNLLWKNKTITIKGRYKRHDSSSTKEALVYNPKLGNFGTTTPKYTIGNKAAIYNGPPNTLVQAVDTPGVCTPGPGEYRPRSAYYRHGIKQSFEKGPRMKDIVPKTPGPTKYTVPIDTNNGPLWSFGVLPKRIQADSSATPGPGTYKIKSTIGTSTGVSISGLPVSRGDDSKVSPTSYTLPSFINNGIMHSMTYRPFETEVEKTPGPSNYTDRNESAHKGPKFTCGKRCPLTYPDAIHHWDHVPKINPDVAPNSYNLIHDFLRSDKPRYSIGKRPKQNVEERPGPASYNCGVVTDTSKGPKPGCSICKRVETNFETYGPGPAAYRPKSGKKGPSYTMSGWSQRKKGVKHDNPAANKYVVSSRITRTGNSQGPAVTLKGRPSPFVYSGFRKVMQL